MKTDYAALEAACEKIRAENAALRARFREWLGSQGQEAGPSGSSPTPAASARPDVAAARTPATTPAEPLAAPPSRDLGAPPVPDVRESGARVAQVGAEPGLADLTSVSPPAPARLDTLAFPRTAVEANRVLEERAAPAVSGLRPSEPGRPGAEFQARQRAVRDARDRISSMERPESKAVAGFADARLSGSLVVPGLQVLAVLALDADGIPGGVRVRQLLEDGDTLEMVHLPPGIEPSVLAPVGDGRTELVLPRAGGWLVVRAAADRQEMLRWVERLGGGG